MTVERLALTVVTVGCDADDAPGAGPACLS